MKISKKTVSKQTEVTSKLAHAKIKHLKNIHPGEVLQKDFLIPMNISVRQLAKGTGLPLKQINELIRGKIGITAEDAIKIGEFLKTGPEFWIKLHANYDVDESMHEDLSSNLNKLNSPNKTWAGKVLRGGVLRIPKELCERYDIETGDDFEVMSQDRILVLIPTKNRPRAYNKILKFAIEVLNSRESAILWLHEPQFGLDWEIPIDYMRTAKGAEAVYTLLGGIKYGMPA